MDAIQPYSTLCLISSGLQTNILILIFFQCQYVRVNSFEFVLHAFYFNFVINSQFSYSIGTKEFDMFIIPSNFRIIFEYLLFIIILSVLGLVLVSTFFTCLKFLLYGFVNISSWLWLSTSFEYASLVVGISSGCPKTRSHGVALCIELLQPKTAQLIGSVSFRCVSCSILSFCIRVEWKCFYNPLDSGCPRVVKCVYG